MHLVYRKACHISALCSEPASLGKVEGLVMRVCWVQDTCQAVPGLACNGRPVAGAGNFRGRLRPRSPGSLQVRPLHTITNPISSELLMHIIAVLRLSQSAWPC